MVYIVVANSKEDRKKRHDDIHNRIHRDTLNSLKFKGISSENFTPEAFEQHYADHYKSHPLFREVDALRKELPAVTAKAEDKEAKKLFHTPAWHRKALTKWEKALKAVKECKEHCEKETDNMPKDKKKHFEKMRKVRDGFIDHAEEEIKFHKLMIDNL